MYVATSPGQAVCLTSRVEVRVMAAVKYESSQELIRGEIDQREKLAATED